MYLNFDSLPVSIGSTLNLKILEQPISDFKDWLTYSIINLKEEVLIQIASVVYNIWQARNQSIYEGKFVPEEDIIQRSSRCVSDFIQANSPDLNLNMQHHPGQHLSRPVRLCRWIPP
jgi:hypothetical protein